jgi:hypothetical protein
LAAGSSGATIKNITKDSTPDFVGTITDLAPPANFLQNQFVFIDISTKGDGIFDRLAVATGKTDAKGNFTAVFDSKQAPLPNSVYNVGPDGILGTSDDTGYSIARVRILDQSGNASSLTDKNAAISFVVDTQGPKVTGSDPLPGGQPPSTTSGIIPVAISFSENISTSSLNSNTIKVVRSGPDGVLGTGDDVNVSIDAASIVLQNLGSTSGAELLRFNIIGATVSDTYQVTLLGTGTAAVTDIAGNNLDGEGNTFPSGDGVPGGNFNLIWHGTIGQSRQSFLADLRGDVGGPAWRYGCGSARRLYRIHHAHVAGQADVSVERQHRHERDSRQRPANHHPGASQRHHGDDDDQG